MFSTIIVLFACSGEKLSPQSSPRDVEQDTEIEPSSDIQEPSEPSQSEPSQEEPSQPASEPSEPDSGEPDPAEIEGWNLIWRDEFDGNSIDSSKWEHEVNAWGGGNNELQYYTASSANSRVIDGKLIIEARAGSYTGDEGTRDYTSARLRTLNKGDWLYGRMEGRMKLPTGQGSWPAFWMLPTDWAYGGWAASGEIDIMELVGHEPSTVHGTLHYGGEWPQNTYSGEGYSINGSFADDFHVFAVEWDPGEIRWYVDGVHYQTQTNWYSSAGAYPAPFNQRFHIILNVAVGGNWPGNPDATTFFPQLMEVDYVRVYQRAESARDTDLTLTVDTNCMTEVAGPAAQVALTGPWAGNWDPGQAITAIDNGDGTWSVTMNMPTSNLEYLWIVNGIYENLIDNAQAGEVCAPVTDYQNFANRVWTVGSGNQSVAYGQCQACP